ncbi:hypothetical protein [Polaromonas sp.]|uniref:hypothetical protein n=1 Tax=Polaromonas sp. TaxID=1869339 RepID=UPI00352AA6D9
MNKFIVTQPQIQSAMKVFEALAGPRDGVTICKEVSQLADVLGLMWYEHEDQAVIQEGSKVHALLVEAGQVLEPFPAAGEDLATADAGDGNEQQHEAPGG